LLIEVIEDVYAFGRGQWIKGTRAVVHVRDGNSLDGTHIKRLALGAGKVHACNKPVVPAHVMPPHVLCSPVQEIAKAIENNLVPDTLDAGNDMLVMAHDNVGTARQRIMKA
jgi:hypothetical protein